MDRPPRPAHQGLRHLALNARDLDAMKRFLRRPAWIRGRVGARSGQRLSVVGPRQPRAASRRGAAGRSGDAGEAGARSSRRDRRDGGRRRSLGGVSREPRRDDRRAAEDAPRRRALVLLQGSGRQHASRSSTIRRSAEIVRIRPAQLLRSTATSPAPGAYIRSRVFLDHPARGETRGRRCGSASLTVASHRRGTRDASRS